MISGPCSCTHVKPPRQKLVPRAFFSGFFSPRISAMACAVLTSLPALAAFPVIRSRAFDTKSMKFPKIPLIPSITPVKIFFIPSHAMLQFPVKTPVINWITPSKTVSKLFSTVNMLLMANSTAEATIANPAVNTLPKVFTIAVNTAPDSSLEPVRRFHASTSRLNTCWACSISPLKFCLIPFITSPTMYWILFQTVSATPLNNSQLLATISAAAPMARSAMPTGLLASARENTRKPFTRIVNMFRRFISCRAALTILVKVAGMFLIAVGIRVIKLMIPVICPPTVARSAANLAASCAIKVPLPVFKSPSDNLSRLNPAISTVEAGAPDRKTLNIVVAVAPNALNGAVNAPPIPLKIPRNGPPINAPMLRSAENPPVIAFLNFKNAPGRARVAS